MNASSRMASLSPPPEFDVFDGVISTPGSDEKPIATMSAKSATSNPSTTNPTESSTKAAAVMPTTQAFPVRATTCDGVDMEEEDDENDEVTISVRWL